MRFADLNVVTTFRPEQYQLQTELRKLGIESELEFRILRDEYRCEKHGRFPSTWKPNPVWGICPNCSKLSERMYYQYDLHLLQLYQTFLVELNGSIHKKKGVMRHDELKLMFAESKGYTLLSYSSHKKPYKIALEIQKRLDA